MAITFPDNPAENELWTVDGRVYYIYKSSAWHQVFGQRPMRNRVGNPKMQASQQNGNSAGGGSGYFAADQWFLQFGGTGAVNFNRSGGEGGRVIDVTITTATASPTWLMMANNIEGYQVSDLQWGSANAKPVVMSFVFNSSISGQFSVALRNNDNTRAFLWPFTVTPAQASLWIQRSIPIPGDVTGTWLVDQRIGINMMVTLASTPALQAPGWFAGNGHGVTGQVNGMATVGNVFRLTEVSLHLDTNGKVKPQRFESPGLFDNYRQCQRYLEKAGITTPGGLPVEPLMAWGYKAMKRVNPAYTIIQGAPTGAGYGILAHDGLWGFRCNPQATGAVDQVVLMDARL
jgi:hypothetical protein